MQRNINSLGLIACGMLALMIAGALGPAPSPVAAMPALQPSPRPTLVPTADLTQVDDSSSAPTPVPYGRITGTVIDLRTNMPMSNILVLVGDSLVITDENGNYDRWVVSGFYDVDLQLRENEGTPIQPMQSIAVGADDTVVVHLFYTSPDQTPAAPEVPTTMPTVAPVAVPTEAAPIAMPPIMPDTSRTEDSAVSPVEDATEMPASLPNTALSIRAGAGLWFLAGLLLIAAGIMVQMLPRREERRRIADERRFLAGLLSRNPTARLSRHADTILRELLDREID
jgi:hypothetical protein